jgi:hypothetical protein
MGDEEELELLVDTADASKPKPEDGEQPPEADPPPVSSDPEDA